MGRNGECEQCGGVMIRQTIPSKLLKYEKQQVYRCGKCGFMVNVDGYWKGYHPANTSLIGYILEGFFGA